MNTERGISRWLCRLFYNKSPLETTEEIKQDRDQTETETIEIEAESETEKPVRAIIDFSFCIVLRDNIVSE